MYFNPAGNKSQCSLCVFCLCTLSCPDPVVMMALCRDRSVSNVFQTDAQRPNTNSWSYCRRTIFCSYSSISCWFDYRGFNFKINSFWILLFMLFFGVTWFAHCLKVFFLLLQFARLNPNLCYLNDRIVLNCLYNPSARTHSILTQTAGVCDEIVEVKAVWQRTTTETPNVSNDHVFQFLFRTELQ